MMDDGEVLSTPGDKRGGWGGALSAGRRIPRHRNGRQAHAAPVGQALIWSLHEDLAEDLPQPDPVFGAFPLGFVEKVMPLLACRPEEVIHVCSGRLPPGTPGVRVDIRPEARPDVVADGRALPFQDNTFGAALIDPPYSSEYARELYGCEYPRPSALLREAARVVVPGGRIGMLHFLVPSPVRGTSILEIRGVSLGCGYRMRAFVVFRVDERRLPFGEA